MVNAIMILGLLGSPSVRFGLAVVIAFVLLGAVIVTSMLCNKLLKGTRNEICKLPGRLIR